MTNETNQVALAKIIKEAQDNHSPIAAREAAKFLAGVYKIYFEEYVKAGFTEMQALRLTARCFD